MPIEADLPPTDLPPTDLPPSERLNALWDHLGLAAAHVATPIPGDIALLAARYPGHIAGAVLCVPSRLDPAPFATLGGRLLMIAAEGGPSADATERAALRLPEARRMVLAGYEAPGSWADACADRGDEIAAGMIAFLGRIAAQGHAADAPRPVAAEGSHAGITYRIEGSGPALILLPFFLAPSQWEPAIPLLARHFTVVTLGGPHLGGVASLEDRARMRSYQAMFHALIDRDGAAPGRGDPRSRLRRRIPGPAAGKAARRRRTRSPRPMSTRSCCAKRRHWRRVRG